MINGIVSQRKWQLVTKLSMQYTLLINVNGPYNVMNHDHFL